MSISACDLSIPESSRNLVCATDLPNKSHASSGESSLSLSDSNFIAFSSIYLQIEIVCVFICDICMTIDTALSWSGDTSIGGCFITIIRCVFVIIFRFVARLNVCGFDNILLGIISSNVSFIASLAVISSTDSVNVIISLFDVRTCILPSPRKDIRSKWRQRGRLGFVPADPVLLLVLSSFLRSLL